MNLPAVGMGQNFFGIMDEKKSLYPNLLKKIVILLNWDGEQ